MAEHEPDSGLYEHADPLDVLNRSVPLEQKLASIHEALYAQIEFVDRISVVAYDPATDLLKTFLASSPGRNNLVRYEARLADSPSLAEILRAGRPRMVNDLELFRRGAICTPRSSRKRDTAGAIPSRCISTVRSGDSSSSTRAVPARWSSRRCSRSTCMPT